MSDAGRDRALLLLGLALGAAIGAAFLVEPGLSERIPQRIALAATGAALVGARWSVPRHRRWLAPAIAAWAGLVLGSTLGADVPRAARGEVRPWSQYHYLLNSKYFPELGYTGLYEQTLAADRASPAPAIGVRRIRDLRTYEIVAVDRLAIARGEAWSDARWAAFRADLAWFLPRLPWDEVLFDRGYNASPSGNAVYRQLARLPVSTRSHALVGLLDPVLLAVAFGAAGWVFGPVRALTAAAWVLLFYGNEHRVVGSFLQYDYLVALVLGACAWRRGRSATAGALVAYAAMVRVFPGLLVAGVAAWAAGRWRATGGVDRRAVRFGAAFVAGCALLAVAGSLSARGPAAWVEWAENIALHAEQHRTGERRLGLAHVFTHPGPGGGDWPSRRERVAAWEAHRPAWAVAAALGALLWAGAAVRGGRRGDDPLDHFAIALVLAFLGVVVSRYYGSAACLLILLGPGRDERGPGEPYAAGLLAAVAAHYLFAWHESDRFAQYFVANGVWAVGWTALLTERVLRTR